MENALSDYDVTSVKYLEDYVLELVFRNGKKGVIDFSRFFGTIKAYDRLRDIDLFKRVALYNGYLMWEGEDIDIAPETLYHEATGDTYPEWMDSMSSAITDSK